MPALSSLTLRASSASKPIVVDMSRSLRLFTTLPCDLHRLSSSSSRPDPGLVFKLVPRQRFCQMLGQDDFQSTMLPRSRCWLLQSCSRAFTSRTLHLSRNVATCDILQLPLSNHSNPDASTYAHRAICSNHIQPQLLSAKSVFQRHTQKTKVWLYELDDESCA